MESLLLTTIKVTWAWIVTQAQTKGAEWVTVLILITTAIVEYLGKKKKISIKCHYIKYSDKSNNGKKWVESYISYQIINPTDYPIGITEYGLKLFDGKLLTQGNHPYHTNIHNIDKRDGFSAGTEVDRRIGLKDILYFYAKNEMDGKMFKFFPNGKWKSRVKYLWLNY